MCNYIQYIWTFDRDILVVIQVSANAGGRVV